MATKRKTYTRLQCSMCKNLNYSAHKSKMSNVKEGEGKLAFKKFCKHCRKHTSHKETKK